MSATFENREPSSITFVVATNNREILEKNLLASPCLCGTHRHQIVVQEDFKSAAAAYNDALDKSSNDLIVFCHQDMFFPPGWISDLQSIIERLEIKDPDWGVLGCFGATQDGQLHGYVHSSGLGILGRYSDPTEVQTLDEIVLIVRRSSGLRFDASLPNFHLYGTDICLRAASIGKRNYAISAFCIHNTYQAYTLPKEFFDCCDHIRRTWKKSLPIQTPCIRLTRLSIPVLFRKLSQVYFKHIRRTERTVLRVADPRQIFERIAESVRSSV